MRRWDDKRIRNAASSYPSPASQKSQKSIAIVSVMSEFVYGIDLIRSRLPYLPFALPKPGKIQFNTYQNKQ